MKKLKVNPEAVKRCMALRNGVPCGSTENIINHHLSYNPEIEVPLCRSCHGKAHFSKKPASTYDYYDIFKSGVRPESWKSQVLVLRGYVVGFPRGDERAVCVKCGEEFESEEDLCMHVYHNYVEGKGDQALRRAGFATAR